MSAGGLLPGSPLLCGNAADARGGGGGLQSAEVPHVQGRAQEAVPPRHGGATGHYYTDTNMCSLELETMVYMKVCNHGEGPY